MILQNRLLMSFGIIVLLLIAVAVNDLYFMNITSVKIDELYRNGNSLQQAPEHFKAALMEIRKSIVLDNIITFIFLGAGILTVLLLSFYYSGKIKKTLENLKGEISDRKIADEELLKTRNYLKNIIDSMSSVLISINRDGIITQWNNAAERETGIPAIRAIDRKIWELIPTLKQYEGNFEEVIKKRMPLEFRRETLSIEERRYFNISFYPLVFNGTGGVVIRLDDVTELERKEFQLRQAQKMETVGNLASGLAHDFNNVLAGIIGSISLLEFMMNTPEGVDNSMLKDHIGIIGESAKRASDMVNQLLSLSRKQDLSFSTIDLALVVRNVVNLCSNTFDKSIEIRVSLPSENAYVSADFTQIEQVLLNLCVNAEHAMTVMKKEGERQGGIMIISLSRVTFDSDLLLYHPEADLGDYWMLSVEDTGVGIDKKIMPKIFDPFFTTKEKEKGTGLGLAMVYNIIYQHNGFVETSSKVGAGTEFRVYLPADGTGQMQASKDNASPARGSEKILIADDEENVRIVMKRMLEKCGYDVLLAKEGVECIKMFNKNPGSISLVILDMSMPKLSGKDTFIELKKIKPDVRVLISSGYKNDKRVLDTLALGAAGVINKPFSMIEITNKVREILNS